ncbi:MAG: HDOD domain-containing protein [Desulfuromonadaceae bacterium]
MKTVQGDLGLMSLRDLLQWGEVRHISGSLKVKHEDLTKTFYLQEGKAVFLTSNKEGERVGEFLAEHGGLGLPLIKGAIEQSQRSGIPFTAFLLEEQIIDLPTLEVTLRKLLIMALADTLEWPTGQFQVTDVLPPAILNGPIQLDTRNLLEQVERYQQEQRREPSAVELELVKRVAERIHQGDIDIPPIPDMLIRLNQCMQSEDGPAVQDVLKIIMADQILTAKILKVANSAYYGFSSQVTSLQHAIVYMGFDAMLSIVMAYSLNKISIKNNAEVRDILRHSLMCAYLAKKIGATIGFDEEEAFVCGLLHDIGKTILVTLLTEFEVTTEMQKRIMQNYHPHAGSLLAIKWNLPEVVRTAIKFHHTPDKAPYHNLAAEVVFLANSILHEQKDFSVLQRHCAQVDFARLDIDIISKDLANIEEAAGLLM